jgi:hypothetical protein
MQRYVTRKITVCRHEKFVVYDKLIIFASHFGVLAQLARALDWQSKGQGFDSPILHTPECKKARMQKGDNDISFLPSCMLAFSSFLH